MKLLPIALLTLITLSFVSFSFEQTVIPPDPYLRFPFCKGFGPPKPDPPSPPPSNPTGPGNGETGGNPSNPPPPPPSSSAGPGNNPHLPPPPNPCSCYYHDGNQVLLCPVEG